MILSHIEYTTNAKINLQLLILKYLFIYLKVWKLLNRLISKSNLIQPLQPLVHTPLEQSYYTPNNKQLLTNKSS